MNPARPPPAAAEAAFAQLLGRQATDAERLRLRAIQETLGIDSHDAVWLIFVALDHYHTLYEQFPALIRAAAAATLVDYQEHLDTRAAALTRHLNEQARQLQEGLQVEAAAAATASQQALVRAIAQSAQRIAVKALRGPRWPWIIGGATVMALALLAGIGVGVGYGYARGYTEGYTAALPLAPAARPVRPRDP